MKKEDKIKELDEHLEKLSIRLSQVRAKVAGLGDMSSHLREAREIVKEFSEPISVQEQSKQEVNNDLEADSELHMSVLLDNKRREIEELNNKLYHSELLNKMLYKRFNGLLHLVRGNMSDTVHEIYDKFKNLIDSDIDKSLPQEQKDKVTGVTEKQMLGLLEEHVFERDDNTFGGVEHITKAINKLLSSKAVEQTKEFICKKCLGTGVVSGHQCDKCSQVETKESYAVLDNKKEVLLVWKGWNQKSQAMICKNSDKYIIYLDEPYPCEITESKAVEQKEPVSDKDLFTLMGRFYFQLERIKGDEAQQIYEVYGKQLRSLFGEKGKED